MIKRFLVKAALAVALALSFPQESSAQWGWQANQYYQAQGQWTKEYDQFYRRNFMDGYEVRYRILRWERRQYTGSILVWSGYAWQSQWQTAWAWYSYWSPWYYEFWRY